MDFTLRQYQHFASTLLDTDYHVLTFRDYLKKPTKKSIIIRHDVDQRASYSLRFATLQNQMGLKGTYYFRTTGGHWEEKIIRAIADMGHEIGYHYECLTTTRGDMSRAIDDFARNLDSLRKIVAVDTICMHGSPTSPHDSKDIWKTYSYRDYGIIGEPYFDLDFKKVLYLTDTGRTWSGGQVSVRDKIQGDALVHAFRHTSEIIVAFEKNQMPNHLMFTFHPQRWPNGWLPWVSELVTQTVKNQVKRHFYVRNY